MLEVDPFSRERLERFRRLIQEARTVRSSPPEKTFFSIAGVIGRYENPTTELLRFFMSPQEAHGLGALFLQAFFRCLGITESERFHGDDLRMESQVRTADGKYIDLLIAGSDWVLVIENKIGHWPANPFASYEAHTTRLHHGKEVFLAILSPDGAVAPESPRWQPVLYHDFCVALRAGLSKAKDSKWLLFALELVTHLENELIDPLMKMTLEQKEFIESHMVDISELSHLLNCHLADVLARLNKHLSDAFPDRRFHFSDSKWTFECINNFAATTRWDLCFQTPAHPGGNTKRAYRVMAWVKGLSEEAQLMANSSPLTRLVSCERGGDWLGDRSFECFEDAVAGLCELAQALLDIFNHAQSSPPPAARES